jgi:hypothetical protein
LRDFVQLAHGAFAVVFDTASTILHLAKLTLRAIYGGTRIRYLAAREVLGFLMLGQLCIGMLEFLFHGRALGGCRFALCGHLRTSLLARRGLGLGSLTARRGVPLTLLGHRHLAANALNLLALTANEPRQFVASRLGGDARTVCGLSRDLGFGHSVLGGR